MISVAQGRLRQDLNFNWPLSPVLSNDLATDLVDLGVVEANIKTLDQMKLTTAELKIKPWSDSYWPTYKGQIGNRYADPKFPNSKIFQENLNYINEVSAKTIIEQNNSDRINQLSPSEKYDLLVGDLGYSLTKFSWAQGQNYLDQNGPVPTWMGICHGWAAAAHLNQPVSHKPITIQLANKISLTFFPSDIKALQSLLWANAPPPSRSTGGRCRTNNPDRDSLGRIIDPNCQDTNPATFHLALINQLGLHQRSFIMDATYDEEVWNFPISGYTYKYFNPQTLEPSTNLEKSMIPVEKFSVDKFKTYRSAAARFIVGVIMDDTYVIEIVPDHEAQEKSSFSTVRHYYDLELDENFQIIGGEWYSKSHPDFMWTFEQNSTAVSPFEKEINSTDWKIDEPPPASWTVLAQKASSRGQPLLAIIQGLLSRE